MTNPTMPTTSTTTTEATTTTSTTEQTTTTTTTETTGTTATDPTETTTGTTETTTETTNGTTETTTETTTDTTETTTTTEAATDTTETTTETTTGTTETTTGTTAESKTKTVMTDTDGRKYVLDENGSSMKGLIVLSPEILIGDVDNSKTVNASDATLILTVAAMSGTSAGVTAQQTLFNKDPEFFKKVEMALTYADANFDGKINANDATAILIYAANLGVDKDTPALGTARYFAGADGFVQTGFIQDAASGASYFADANGVLQTGWQTVNISGTEEKRFFLKDGRMAVNQNVVTEDGKTVKVDENGALPKTGFYDAAEGRYYLNEQGQRVTGFQKIDGKTYYFNAEGILQKGWITADGKTFYGDPTDGSLRIGLLKIGEDTYYFDTENFAMTVNQKLVFTDGERSFGADGKMIRGWAALGNDYYWYDENGLKVTGKRLIDGLYYWFDANGVSKTGWIEDGADTYCCHETDRYMLTGWQTINGFNYYFNADGTMAKNTVVDGKTVQANGYVMSDRLYTATAKIQSDLERYTKNPEGIYQYMRDTNRYKNTERTKTLEELNSYGWGTLVADAADTHYVVCYYMAAKMDYILRICGYNSRIVHATHSSGDHYWNQVEMPGGYWKDYDPTNYIWKDYTWDQMMSAGNFTFLGYVIPDYY